MTAGLAERGSQFDDNAPRRQTGGQARRQIRDAHTTAADPVSAGSEATPADRIWLVLAHVPSGFVTTYGAVARLAGMPRHARLVGRTLGALPDDSRLPWHRVVNASRRLSPRGDAGAVAEQRRRLEAEGIRFNGDRVAPEHLWVP